MPDTMSNIDLMKMVFRPKPGWIKRTEKDGTPATADLVGDPQAILKGIGGYQGKDGWVDVDARIQPSGDAPYEAKVTARLSQVVFGLLEAGQTVNVKIDPRSAEHVLLVDDVDTLLKRRVIS
jgi:hypothetical protein